MPNNLQRLFGFLRRGGTFLQLFVGLWIALFGIGILVWFASKSYQQVPANFGDIEAGPGTRRALHTAVKLWKWNGETALIRWLSDPETNLRPEVFVVDRDGKEISGRPVPEHALQSLAERPNNRWVLRHCPQNTSAAATCAFLPSARIYRRGTSFQRSGIRRFGCTYSLPFLRRA